MSDQKVCVLFHTAEYRGDHAADVVRVIDVEPTDTIGALASKLLGKNQYAAGEYLSIRLVERLP